MAADILLPDGTKFRSGIIQPPADAVGAFPTFESAFQLMDNQQLKDAFASFGDTDVRSRFTDGWIHNQNPYNSCCPTSATGAAERAVFIRTGNTTKLSAVAAYSLINGGTDNGAVLANMMAVLRDRGMIERAKAKPDQIYQYQYPKGYYDDGKRFRFIVREARSERAVLTGLARRMMALVAVEVQNPFANFKGGANDLVPGTSGGGNHAVGLQNAKWSPKLGRFVFDMFNSWGTVWGDRGYGWLSWDTHMAEPNHNHVFYLIETAEDDPNDPSLPPAVASA